MQGLPDETRYELNREFIRQVCDSGSYCNALAGNEDDLKKIVKFKSIDHVSACLIALEDQAFQEHQYFLMVDKLQAEVPKCS